MLKTQLTAEQSAKLIELGVSPERASMRESSVAYGNGARGIMKAPPNSHLHPRRFSLAPTEENYIRASHQLPIEDAADYIFKRPYLRGVASVLSAHIKANAEAPELIDALYSLLLWCLEKGYVK